ncbi:MAG: hypothetical protein ABIP08_10085 [Lautropia sp.]
MQPMALAHNGVAGHAQRPARPPDADRWDQFVNAGHHDFPVSSSIGRPSKMASFFNPDEEHRLLEFALQSLDFAAGLGDLQRLATTGVDLRAALVRCQRLELGPLAPFDLGRSRMSSWHRGTIPSRSAGVRDILQKVIRANSRLISNQNATLH